MAVTVASPMEYEALPSRVVFGIGAVARVGAELERLDSRRALLVDGLVDGEVAGSVADALGPRHAVTLGDVRQHVPADLVATARSTATSAGVDALVALGGGSAVGLAKAIALETQLPILAIPTTYAGSEMTPIWGVTTDAHKQTGRDLAVLPRVVLYDPALTVSFPPAASAASGMNAIAHCVEALWTATANPITDAIATDGIRLLAAGLRGVVRDPSDLAARSTALRGAWLGGTALAIGGTALHHKICHVLGGAFDMPHAEVHAHVLPAVVEHFRAAAPAALKRIAAALGVDDAVAGLHGLRTDLGLSGGLADLGLDAAGIELVSERVAASAPDQPASVTQQDVRSILRQAAAA